MSSKPPFDMTTTRSPCAALARDGPNDVVDARDVARVHARGLQIGDHLLGRQPLDPPAGSSGTRRAAPRGPRRPSARAKSDWKIRRHDVAERGSKIAQMRRSGIRRAHARERLGNRGRMMGEVVVDRDAVGRAAQLQPPADALEPPQPLAPSCRCSGRPPRRPRSPPARCARCRRRAAAPRTCPIASPRARTLNAVDVCVDLRSCACQSAPSDSPNVSTAACARVRAAPAPRRCRRRAAAARGAAPG